LGQDDIATDGDVEGRLRSSSQMSTLSYNNTTEGRECLLTLMDNRGNGCRWLTDALGRKLWAVLF